MSIRGPRIDVTVESKRLAADADAQARNPRMAAMREVRQRLPAFSQKQDVVARLAAGRVLVVSGATGAKQKLLCPGMRLHLEKHSH